MTWWIFGRKNEKNNKITLYPSTVAGFVVELLIERKLPFYEWNLENVPIPENLSTFIIGANLLYVLFEYFAIIELKFGKDLKEIIKNHTISQLNKFNTTGTELNASLNYIDSCLKSTDQIFSFKEKNIPSEFGLCFFMLTTLPMSPYYLSKEEAKDPQESFKLKFNNISEMENVISIVTKCFTLSKKSADLIFNNLLDHVNFKPDIVWSTNPGCFERYLKVKFNNLLFSSEQRLFSQEDVDEALIKDKRDANILKQDISDFLSTINFDTPITLEMFNKIRDKLQRFIIRAFEIGGDEGDSSANSLLALRNSLISDLKKTIVSNEKVLVALENADELSCNLINFYRVPFISQIMRKDSPIRGNEIETLLSENVETIALFVHFLSEDDLSPIRKQVNVFLINLFARGIDPFYFDEKLKILGVVYIR